MPELRRFYLHQRSNSFFYAELIDPLTRRKAAVRSTGCTTRDEALEVVYGWLRDGIPSPYSDATRPVEAFLDLDRIICIIRADSFKPEDAKKILHAMQDRGFIDGGSVCQGKGSEFFITWLENFWNYDTSPYVAEKLARKHSMGKRRCYDQCNNIKNHWKPYFTNKRLGDIHRIDLKAFSLALSAKGLKAGSINRIMSAGTVALGWAFRNELIEADPTIGLMGFSEKADRKIRGVLTPDEAVKVFQVFWENERSCVGNLVAATTGLRAGEVLALRVDDIGNDRLHICHSYSVKDGLKAPKNGETRTVPLLPHVRNALLELAAKNPWGPSGFIFFSTLEHQPMSDKILLSGLVDALAKIGINGNTRKARGIVFHSWRHYYASRMADRCDARKIMQATGHKTNEVFEAYAAHAIENDFKIVSAAALNAFREFELPNHLGSQLFS